MVFIMALYCHLIERKKMNEKHYRDQIEILDKAILNCAKTKNMSLNHLWVRLSSTYERGSSLDNGQHLYRLSRGATVSHKIDNLYRIAYVLKCRLDFNLAIPKDSEEVGLYDEEPIVLALSCANPDLPLKNKEPIEALMSISKNIKQRRKELRWSQKQLSQKANISKTTLSKIEVHASNLELRTLIKIDTALRNAR